MNKNRNVDRREQKKKKEDNNYVITQREREKRNKKMATCETRPRQTQLTWILPDHPTLTTYK